MASANMPSLCMGARKQIPHYRYLALAVTGQRQENTSAKVM